MLGNIIESCKGSTEYLLWYYKCSFRTQVISLLTTAIKCKAQQITNQNLRVVTLRKYAYLLQASMHCLKKELKD